MKSKYFLRVLSLVALLVSLVPARNADALSLVEPPPADMFQLPWDLGIAWVAIDGIDNGTRRPLSSSHHYSVGGAIDFAPHNNMRKGEDTSGFWVAAAASGTVIAKSFCHVKIDHGNGWTTEYQFLANVSVNVGDRVSRNQRIGILADGIRHRFCPGSNEPNVPHVHFMLRPSVRNATLAGWEVNYLPILSRTTFLKNGQTFGLFKPLLNVFDQIQIVLRGPITWDTLQSGTVDSFRYERWSLTLDALTEFTLTATPTTSGLIPLILLLDASGNEISRSSGTLTSTQPAGNYFVQIQPEAGSGSYTLLAQRNELPSGPFVSTTVSPPGVNVGQAATATVRLNNVPMEGYTSAEFTCTYNSTLATVSNIVVADLFGTDPAVAISDPQGGSFIVAVAGSKGNKATTDGTAFTFSLTGSQAGQTAIECKARVSQGNNVLTAIDFVPGSLTVTGSTSTPPPPTPGTSPTTPAESPVPTITHSPTPGEPPTSTFTPVPPTPTVLPSVCDRAEFIADVTVPTGTVLAPGATFTKTWRLKNIGPCDWTTSYRLVFFSGEQMGAVSSSALPTNVPSGATVDISINMTAPNAPGSYRGFWMFQNSSGTNFGIGPDANQPWFVDITVSGPTLPPSLTPTRPPSSPTPTFTPGGPTATPGATCNKAEFIADVTTPPGTVMLPGSMAGKVWLVKNVGTCTWTPSYGWIFVDGELMDAPLSNTFADNVDPGEVAEVYLSFTAPLVSGHYQSFWKLHDASGVQFGVGESGNDPLVLDIVSSGPTVTPTLISFPTSPTGVWLTFTNDTYNFRFLYPEESQIIPGGNDNSTRINLPFVQGTNLREKYLQMSVNENVNPCQSPLSSISPPGSPTETVVFNGISFLKQVGGDAGVGHLHEWVGYSTLKGNACISMDFVLHSLNSGNFATPVPEFDKAAESLVFGQIVSTFQWLDSPVTSTPTAPPSTQVESPTPTFSTPVGSPTPTSLPDGTVTGTVIASKPVTVGLYNASDVLVTSTTANPDGTFSLTAPAGTYTIKASTSGFLRAQGSVTLTGGGTSTKPTLSLLAGDIDGNDVIDQFDALTIGMSYNTAVPSEADLNADGVINVLDLELLASNYRKSAPQDWS